MQQERLTVSGGACWSNGDVARLTWVRFPVQVRYPEEWKELRRKIRQGSVSGDVLDMREREREAEETDMMRRLLVSPISVNANVQIWTGRKRKEV